MDATVHIAGLEELKWRLSAVPQKVEAKVVRGAMVESARIIRDQARENAPFYHGDVQQGAPPPGTLKKSIIIKYIPEKSGNGRFVYYVAVRHGKKYQKTGKKQINRDAFYWYFVEFGHYTRPAGGGSFDRHKRATGRFGSAQQVANFEKFAGVRFVPPVSFMRRAFASKSSAAVSTMIATMEDGIIREAKAMR